MRSVLRQGHQDDRLGFYHPRSCFGVAEVERKGDGVSNNLPAFGSFVGEILSCI